MAYEAWQHTYLAQLTEEERALILAEDYVALELWAKAQDDGAYEARLARLPSGAFQVQLSQRAALAPAPAAAAAPAPKPAPPLAAAPPPPNEPLLAAQPAPAPAPGLSPAAAPAPAPAAASTPAPAPAPAAAAALADAPALAGARAGSVHPEEENLRGHAELEEMMQELILADPKDELEDRNWMHASGPLLRGRGKPGKYVYSYTWAHPGEAGVARGLLAPSSVGKEKLLEAVKDCVPNVLAQWRI